MWLGQVESSVVFIESDACSHSMPYLGYIKGFSTIYKKKGKYIYIYIYIYIFQCYL
jgi:hypothetical protein